MVMARFACGSMVLDLFFHKKNHFVNFFVKKPEISHPVGGDIFRQIRDRLIQVSIGRFVVFARFVVFVIQTPTA